MKKYILIASAAALLFSCNRGEVTETNHEKDSLLSVVNERNTSINDFLASFNEIESNLDSVALKQHIISQNTDKPGELKPNQKARINDEIAAINSLMDQNRKKIAELSHKLKSSGTKNGELEKSLVTLNNQLVQKDAELTTLNEKLNALNSQVAVLQTSVTVLTADNSAKTQTIADETAALHTAYFVVGNSRDLQDAKLIDRKGGLLGIGKTSRLSDNIDNSRFTRIDYTQTGTIPVNGDDIKIITTHPSDSYSLNKDDKNKDMVKSIMITNPEKFWSASKYLVVIKD